MEISIRGARVKNISLITFEHISTTSCKKRDADVVTVLGCSKYKCIYSTCTCMAVKYYYDEMILCGRFYLEEADITSYQMTRQILKTRSYSVEEQPPKTWQM